MTPLIDRALFDGRSIASVVFAPADKADLTLNVVDVGARNGNYMLPASYAMRTRLTGFEPNRAEYDKLLAGTADAMAAELVEPPFKSKAYHPCALWSENTERTLYLTAGAGAVTLMGPASARMTGNMWRTQDRGRAYYDSVQRVVGTAKVTCYTLDHIWRDSDGVIDIFKLDAEGSELEILKGASAALQQKKVLFIFTEFLLLPFYEQRVTLGHQQVFLDDFGYRLISLNLDHYRYNWRKTAIEARHDKWLNYAGDAIFVLDPDRNELSRDDMYRLGLACMAMGFNAFGLNLIRETSLLAAQDIAAIEAAANRPSLARRLRLVWADVPFAVARLASRLPKPLRPV